MYAFLLVLTHDLLELSSWFANDLPESVISGSLYLYADDTTVYCIKRTADEAVAQLNEALNELYNWVSIKPSYSPFRKKWRLS